ncbi:DUF418 domain-containing protein [Nonomuraea sp. NPDC002799]
MRHQAAPAPSRSRPRIAALDVIRGFALCGILLANVRPITNRGGVVVTDAATGLTDLWLGLLVEQRFFPIFSLLFGVGFSLLLASARDRVPHPRLLLLRRLLVLLGVGLIHMFTLWQGDILTIYAAVGLVVLLPSTWLPRRLVPVLAVAFIAAALIFGGGGVSLVPGLFLLGSALSRYGVIDRIEGSARVPAVLCVLFAAAAVPAVQADAFATGGLLTAGLYVCAMLVLLRTPLRRPLRALFAPLGQMALTNYLAATVLVLAGTHLLGLRHDMPWGAVFLIAGAILTAQWIFSTLWSRRFRQGPLEWLWRWATWGRRPPLRCQEH